MNYDEDRRRAAATRSYTTPAVITLILYLFLWLPGFIVNLVYLQNAGRDERMSGYAPEGKGCLTALLWVFTIIPVILVVLALVLVAA